VTHYRGKLVSTIHVPAKFDESINGYVPLDAIWTGDSDYIIISNDLLFDILSTSDYGEGTRFNIGPYQLELTSDDLPFKDNAWVAKRIGG
jgi:hypothetical protein